MKTYHEDFGKLEELIVYIARRCDSDQYFGATKLNKILFAVDFLAYRDLGSPVTGQRYQKLPYGPAPRGLLPALNRLKADSACIEYERPCGVGRTQRRVVALRDADLSRFTAQQISLADRIIEEMRKEWAEETSKASHEFLGWKAVDFNEDIPYETIFVEDPGLPFTPDELDYAKQLAGAAETAAPADR